MRQLAPDMPEAGGGVHDRITQALAARPLRLSETGLIVESHPGETWPPGRRRRGRRDRPVTGEATGHDWSPVAPPLRRPFSACAIDPETGYLVQASRAGAASDSTPPRLGHRRGRLLLSFADRDLSGRLHRALRERGHRELSASAGSRGSDRDGADWDGKRRSGPVGVSTGATRVRDRRPAPTVTGRSTSPFTARRRSSGCRCARLQAGASRSGDSSATRSCSPC
jgi:hypothetical protein